MFPCELLSQKGNIVFVFLMNEAVVPIESINAYYRSNFNCVNSFALELYSVISF